MSRLSYTQAKRFIFSREFFGMKLGLENILEYLEELGNPERKFKSVHIAGTNGKGSTAAMIASIFRAQGYKTGLYTSPHLVDFRERIQIDGKKITERAVVSFITAQKKELQKRKLTFFELVTALALDYFAKEKIDVAVIETGLGGRLDATNVLSPNLTITTDIDFDHTEILGRTVRKISREKAGIIKSGTPHLAGLLPTEAVKIIAEICREKDSPFYELNRNDLKLNVNQMSVGFAENGYRFADIRPALYGPHQLSNTALVLKAASIFRNNGLYVSKKAIIDGIVNTDWPGRFQILTALGRPTIVLDVAHNTGGIRAFAESFKIRFPNRRGRFLCGFVQKKNHQSIFDTLNKIAEEFALAPLRTKRTAEPKELAKVIDFREKPVKCFGSLGAGLSYLTKKADFDDIICVVGSHYLVGEFLEKFGAKWPGRQENRTKSFKRRLHRRPRPKIRPKY